MRLRQGGTHIVRHLSGERFGQHVANVLGLTPQLSRQRFSLLAFGFSRLLSFCGGKLCLEQRLNFFGLYINLAKSVTNLVKLVFHYLHGLRVRAKPVALDWA